MSVLETRPYFPASDATAQKWLEKLIVDGYFDKVTGQKDRRTIDLVPTQKLLNFVQPRIAAEVEYLLGTAQLCLTAQPEEFFVVE